MNDDCGGNCIAGLSYDYDAGFDTPIYESLARDHPDWVETWYKYCPHCGKEIRIW